MPRLRRVSSPYVVGRDELAAALDTVLEHALQGEPATVFLTGDAGVGKTRLVQDASRRAGERGFHHLVGHTAALGGADLPFGPLAGVVRHAVKQLGVPRVVASVGPAASELAELAPELRAWAADADRPRDAITGQASLLSAIGILLSDLSRDKPVLVVLEDLHWADRSTIDALPYLAREWADARIALVTTCREEELDEGHVVRRVVAELVRGELASKLEVKPLTRAEQAQQLSGILGVPPTTDVVDRVFARAEGNPFFAEELLAGAGDEDDTVPTTVRELLLARLVGLPEDTRVTLRVASIASSKVSHELLREVCGLDEEALEAALRSATEHHVLTSHLDHYTFRHALLRETVASTVLPGEALRLHGAIARALASGPVRQSDPNPAAALAYHWHAAGDWREALRASLAAARRAAEMYGFAESLEHFQRSFRLWDRVDDAAALAGSGLVVLQQEAAEVAHLAGEAAVAAGLVRQALEQVDPAADPVLAGVLQERLGLCLWMVGDGQGGLAAYERAVDLVPAVPPTRERARVLSGFGLILMMASRFEEARELCTAAIDVAQAVGSRQIEGHALNSLGVAIAHLGEVDAGIHDLREALDIARESGDDLDGGARAIVNLVAVLFAAARWQEAAEEARAGIALVDGLGMQRRKGVWMRCGAVEVLLPLGRWDEAAALARQALALRPEGMDLLVTHLAVASIAIRRGDLAGARDALGPALSASARVVDPQIHGALFVALVELAVLGRESGRALGLAEEGWARCGGDPDARYASALCAVAARAAADVSAPAAQVPPPESDLALWRNRCEQLVGGSHWESPQAELAMCRAEAARGGGDRGEPQLWREAIDSWERLGDPYRVAYCQWRLAEALIAVPGHREDVGVALGQSHRAAVSLGAQALVAEVESFARRARIALTVPLEPEAVADRPFNLTAREHQILVLLAQGSTNREIGDLLFISVRTVGNHVSNLLAKLGASGRVEAAATAHRHGLLPDDR